MPTKTFDDYSSDLQALLSAAEAAVAAGSEPKMTKARDGLRDFVEGSNDLVPGVIELDNVAASARRDLVLALLGSSLVSDIGSRSGEVSRLVKKFSSQSAVNNSEAATLRLERARALSDAALVVVNEFNKFSEHVDTTTPDGKKLADAIQSAIDAVLTVKKRIAT